MAQCASGVNLAMHLQAADRAQNAKAQAPRTTSTDHAVMVEGIVPLGVEPAAVAELYTFFVTVGSRSSGIGSIATHARRSADCG